MDSEETFPGEAELVAAAMGPLTYESITPEREAELLAMLPPPDEVPPDVDDMLVVTSLRIPVGLHNRLKAYAQQRGVKPSVLVREWIELHLSAEEDRPISLADAFRALAGLRPAA